MVRKYHKQNKPNFFKHPGKKDLYIALADRWISGLSQTLPYEKSAEIFERIFNPDYKNQEIERGPEFVVDTTKAGYVWLAFRFDGKMAYLDWKDEWSIEDYD